MQDCVYGTTGGSTRSALFGDSHAAQWFPALLDLARQSGSVIESYTKSSCPPASVTVIDKTLPYANCDTWRDAVVAHLVDDPPDLVVLSGYAWYELAGVSVAERAQRWVEGVVSTVAELRAAGTRVVVIADTRDC